jgi:hypothetical protein
VLVEETSVRLGEDDATLRRGGVLLLSGRAGRADVTGGDHAAARVAGADLFADVLGNRPVIARSAYSRLTSLNLERSIVARSPSLTAEDEFSCSVMFASGLA